MPSFFPNFTLLLYISMMNFKTNRNERRAYALADNRPQLRNLQSLRFIFIFLVFLSHYPMSDGNCVFNPGGDCGVSFFFVLSGFVLSFSYCSNRSYRSFMASRVRKIYPLYIFALVCALLVMRWNFSRANVLPLLTLTQSWFPDRDIYFGGDPTAWFISDILFLYAIYYPLRKLCMYYSWGRTLVALAIVGLCYFAVASQVPQVWVNWGLYVFPPLRMIDFALGILSFRAYDSMKNWIIPSRWMAVLQLFAISLVVGACAVWPYVPERYGTVLLFYVPSMVAVLVFAFSDGAPTVVNSVLSNRMFVWLGSITFEFYLLHVPVIKFVEVVRDRHCHDECGIAWLSVTALLTIVLSVLVHKTISIVKKNC